MLNTLSPVLGGSLDLDYLSPKSLGRVSGRTSSAAFGPPQPPLRAGRWGQPGRSCCVHGAGRTAVRWPCAHGSQRAHAGPGWGRGNAVWDGVLGPRPQGRPLRAAGRVHRLRLAGWATRSPARYEPAGRRARHRGGQLADAVGCSGGVPGWPAARHEPPAAGAALPPRRRPQVSPAAMASGSGGGPDGRHCGCAFAVAAATSAGQGDRNLPDGGAGGRRAWLRCAAWTHCERCSDITPGRL